MMNQVVYFVLVSIYFFFGPKSACAMAIDSDVMEHHRSRRAVLSSHAVIVSASPYMTTSYYFDRNEAITFKVRVSYNGTGVSYTGLNIIITSDWIDLSKGAVVKDMFTAANLDGSKAIFQLDTLNANDVIIGNVSGVVRPDIGPLSSLELNMELNATQSSDEIVGSMTKSSPTVFGVFPEVNMTRGGVDGPINVYNEFPMSMKLVLPVLNYSLLVELTTNIEDYVFMEIKDVIITTTGSDISTSATPVIRPFSSQNNNEMDRFEMNFSNVSIPETGSTESGRTIIIDYKVKVNDHELVANGSTHYFGAGLQAGPKVLWVDQYELVVLKEEPALLLDVTSEQTMNNTRLYIDDIVTFNVSITHHNTSLRDANNLKLGVLSELLTDKGITQETGVSKTYFNDTYIEFDSLNTLAHNTDTIVQIKLKVKNNITPLLDIPVKFFLKYENAEGKAKRPVQYELKGLITATPAISFYLKDHNDTIRPGEKLDFIIQILLVKMASPIQVEV